MISAVEGLAHAHHRGIIHRDLKPANILVADDGSPVLLDFNLAVSSQEAKTRIVGGTLPYMSPQQLEALETGATADERDDVFSIGVILYELLSGKLPFGCPQSGEAFVLDRLILDRRLPPTSIRSLNSRVSPGLEAIIGRCIAADRQQRYRDASELLVDLDRHRQHLPLKYAADRSIRERVSKWSARHPRLSSASSVAILAATILVACSLLIWQRGERMRSMNVEAQWHRLQNDLPRAVAALSTPGREPELLAGGLEVSSRLMSQWHVGSDQWRRLAEVDRLDAPSQQALRGQLGRLAYLMAAAEADIALQSDQAEQSGLADQALLWNRLASNILPELQPLSDFQRHRIASKLDRIRDVGEVLRPTDPIQDLDLRAIWAAESGDITLLRELVRRQLDQQPTNAMLWFNLAVADWRLGDLDRAVASFDVCNRLQPRSLVALFNRGICNLKRGEAQAAKNDFSSCLQLRPQLATARFNRAVAADQLGEHIAALDDLNQLVRSGQASTRMVLMCARVHDSLGDSNASVADRRAARQIPPRDADDWVARGVCQLAGSAQDAQADFEAALRIRPDDFAAINNLAHLYAERLDQPRRAIELLTRLIAIRPSAASPLASRGILRARLGERELAVIDGRMAAERSPTAREQLQIAGIHALLSDQDDQDHGTALAWLARALKSDPSLAQTAGNDSDLANLRGNPQFRRLVGSAMIIESAAR